MIPFLEKIVNSRSIILCFSKVEGTINGGKRYRFMVGCNAGHCWEEYWQGLQEVWKEWKAIQTQDFLDGKIYAIIWVWTFSFVFRTIEFKWRRR